MTFRVNDTQGANLSQEAQSYTVEHGCQLNQVKKDGVIAGAALDVHAQIPLAPDDLLGQLDNVLLTP